VELFGQEAVSKFIFVDQVSRHSDTPGGCRLRACTRGSCVGIVDLSPRLCAMGAMALKVSHGSCSHATPSASGRSGLCLPPGV
jgi:hypothetical protein